MHENYKIHLEVFEGPLDLLLYLVKKDEVDIYDVCLERLTKQFLAYIETASRFDIELAGEFFVMAATLIYLKSRELLPVDQQPPPGDEEEDEEDPRWELIRQLIEYKKFKEAAGELQIREIEQERIFPRRPPPSQKPDTSKPLTAANILDLLCAFDRILKRVQQAGELREVFDENFTVADKINHILALLEAGRVVEFSALFPETASRVEMVVTFLALLELVRMKQILAEQLTPLGQILLKRRPGAPPLGSFTDNEEISSEKIVNENPGDAAAIGQPLSAPSNTQIKHTSASDQLSGQSLTKTGTFVHAS